MTYRETPRCLSFFDVRGVVNRPLTLHVEHQDVDGQRRITIFDRGAARLVAHEIDHLHGLLYTNRMASALPAERWEVDDDCPGSRLSLTAWIDADDIEQAGSAGAEYRRRFERLVRDLEPGSARRRSADVGVARLAEEYRAAFAGALADTD